MISLPVLGLPNFSLPFDETTDAFQMAIGAVLSQLQHPIAFFSKKLCSRMQSSSSYDREMFAIIEAARKWRHYLLGRGKTVIWVVVDRFSKCAYFIGLPTKFSATSLASVFSEQIYRLHSLPKTIVSDRDRHFFRQFWCDLFRLCGTILAYNSTYHIQSDGRTKSTIGFFSTSILITNLWSTAGLLKNFLATFYGPLRIVKHIGQIAYELALPIRSRVHPVFHFSLLKPFDGDPLSVIDSLPFDVYSTLPNLRPTRILGRRANSASSNDDD
ncbi:Retrovirus-related Pol polyprotein from transposon [Sesamum angolense]|uniref:Retrovirus-related Pol polyprotein from transposon n=1 Tax=Sesamum angolense TaxID=2727404 RepID=A0AAE2BN54_9LAMI|nr:Retrovirus-related Pol polyprotein from transposon [Sesamum angolense]